MRPCDECRVLRGRLHASESRHALLRSELDLFREKLVWSEKRVVELERLLFDNRVALPERGPAPSVPPFRAPR